MSGALGEYFDEPEVQTHEPGGYPPPAGVPVPRMPAVSGALGEYFAQNGLGATVTPLPGRGGVGRMLRKVSPVAGAVGDAADLVTDTKQGVITGVAAATSLTVILIGLGIRFGSGWVIGSQLAPNSGAERKYQWGTALAGTFFGVAGLGVAGLIAQNARK